jgi:hypothetical protein
MMKTIRTIVLAGCLIVLHSCASGQHDQAFQDLELGVAIPCEADPTQLFLIAASQMSPGCEAVIDESRFYFAANQGGTVAFISTRDPRFFTPEGVSVGSTLKEVLGAGGNEVIAEPGWGFYSRLPSGWAARFSGVPGVSGAPPNTNSTAVEVFLRH